MIAIINYEAGNLASVSNALERLNVPFIITNQIKKLEAARAVIFPGVGHARPAMESLQKHNLDGWLRQTKKPLLGICLGMQLLYESSEEGGGTEGLGLLPGTLKKFDNSQKKVPHMGWNTINKIKTDELINNVADNEYFYFVHSYFAPVNTFTLTSCTYGCDFAAIVRRDNVMGAQFHPEKSGDAGHRLLKNFLSIAQEL